VLEEAHLQAIESRISDLKNQRTYAHGRLAKTLDGMIHNEESRLNQWQRLFEIRQHDGE